MCNGESNCGVAGKEKSLLLLLLLLDSGVVLFALNSFIGKTLDLNNGVVALIVSSLSTSYGDLYENFSW